MLLQIWGCQHTNQLVLILGCKWEGKLCWGIKDCVDHEGQFWQRGVQFHGFLVFGHFHLHQCIWGQLCVDFTILGSKWLYLLWIGCEGLGFADLDSAGGDIVGWMCIVWSRVNSLVFTHAVAWKYDVMIIFFSLQFDERPAAEAASILTNLHWTWGPVSNDGLEGTAALMRRWTDFSATGCWDDGVTVGRLEYSVDAFAMNFVPC